ncbi:pyridoxamine 5'-phosphate oxidase family protein [Jiangella aurantiaca]|uniref:Pyridoxamine 5'-phosphate oxidase family protein n=1 Tax=Jiangella aurantiaca TaxID=2530373 RepID=A0A4V2YR17_9ACTN|nr:pyridoxamine 5'-phosphate oxidase family protein [Jiangella aurantiaca]TDD64367.1 pyridoxamine 5'-phosphate oxidase family protein [Jiangella aurantiaca]
MTHEDNARRLIERTRYMSLGTVDPDGRARVSPVYYAPDGYDIFYWMSAPEARHSQNIVRHPEVSMVIYDSTVPIGGDVRAVYLLATAGQVPDDELEACAPVACRARFPERQEPFPVEWLYPPERLRLWRARVTEHSVHVRGSDPEYGTGIDTRRVVTL